MLVRVGVAAMFALISAVAGADEKISMRVSPSVAFAPANLSVRTTIAADAKNRAIEIVAESTDFYRSSEMQLDGESAPKTTIFQFRSLPTGEYSVRAVLRGQGGRELASTAQIVNIVDAASSMR
jgi:hypothetical protein